MKMKLQKTGRLLAQVATVCLVMAGTASAQTVRPVINELRNGELRKPAKGYVEYVNDSLTPLNVVLEAKSFTVSETGEMSYRPLDDGIHLRLSATSFRIQPKESYYVSYEASADKGPAWFVIYAAFSGFAFRIQPGINTRILLPHVVYLLPKQSLRKDQVHVQRAEFVPLENKVLIDVANDGDFFGRVQETWVQWAKNKQEAPGFPLFPHSHRILEVKLDHKGEGENVPLSVLVRFENFKLEEKLQRREVTASVDRP